MIRDGHDPAAIAEAALMEAMLDEEAITDEEADGNPS